MTKSTLCAIALSIASEPVKRGIYVHLEEGACAEEIFYKASLVGDLITQPFIAEKYSHVAIRAAEEIVRECERTQIAVIDFWHNEYPPLLREIRYPPLVLYRKGKPRSANFFSIVGTRHADSQAVKITKIFSSALARHGFTIVSGMALGIDKAAHVGALDGGGATVGILANGIDIIYPLQNHDLFQRIAQTEGSCLFSEYPPHIVAGKWTFVRRNRIISGMSKGTLVVKAGEKSGALITARYALEQGREVFACPGSALDDGYAGCHRLIKAGAVLASTPDDILKEMNVPALHRKELFAQISDEMVEGMKYLFEGEDRWQKTGAIQQYPPDSIERKILDFATRSCNIDELIRKLDVDAALVNEKITLLEIEGLVEKQGTTLRTRL